MPRRIFIRAAIVGVTARIAQAYRGVPLPHRIFAWAAIVSLFLDQVSKILAYGLLTKHVPVRVVGDVLRLSLTSNDRGLFGLSYGPRFLYLVLPLIGMALVIYFALKTKDRWLSASYGMILGGAVGNLVDRVRLGDVIDFIDAGVRGWRWYTFNLADAAVVVGIIMLLGREMFPGRKLREEPGAGLEAPGPDATRRSARRESGDAPGSPAGIPGRKSDWGLRGEAPETPSQPKAAGDCRAGDKPTTEERQS